MLERLLVDAGVGEGMRVLDVGCGHGAVTQLRAGGLVVFQEHDATSSSSRARAHPGQLDRRHGVRRLGEQAELSQESMRSPKAGDRHAGLQCCNGAPRVRLRPR
jgi:hypothetical protein